MGNVDYSADSFSVRRELHAGIRALEEHDFSHAHTTLLALFLSPDVPSWFRTVFCTPPLRQAARTYLPTRAALRRIRQRAESRLMNGDHNPLLLQRALMFNDALADLRARHRLLRQLDAVASGLLAGYAAPVIVAFAEHADMQRARRYLGDYRLALMSLSGMQDTRWLYGADGGWSEGADLANTAEYVRRLGVIEAILRANGEREQANDVSARAAASLTRAKFRRQVAREQRDPGWCARELAVWCEREQILDEPHGRHASRARKGSNAIA